ncbi:uncharacterized protein MYCGRDRAFT_106171 [Zymoseptoria tritici IPO323]|uniref:Uncharacterized protein n=1 Tax=Zymoseptoria tritici (strain CBS 115943 / IPO323) TaxID=336722 RepID=F9XNB4_ZYMTI|nr:uncharacterized protein MYCGRDRAFT_106171 [Zymoseptoria tritici IPO323]EGP83385.1 hypothetical protein MYCGRDRAFT_106171 [Zymoseptoria tritici IPO323]
MPGVAKPLVTTEALLARSVVAGSSAVTGGNVPDDTDDMVLGSEDTVLLAVAPPTTLGDVPVDALSEAEELGAEEVLPGCWLPLAIISSAEMSLIDVEMGSLLGAAGVLAVVVSKTSID